MIAGYQTAMYTSAWHLTALLESGFHATKITGAADRDSSRVQGVYVHPQLHIERAFRLGKRFALIPSVGLVWKYTSAPFARLAETEAVHNHDVGFGMSRSDLEDLHNGLGVQMRVDLGYAFD
jgi:hypothetical protein